MRDFITSEKGLLIGKLCEAIIACDKEEAIRITREIVKRGLDIVNAIEEGLVKGAREVGEKFDRLEIFLSELMMTFEAMQKA